MQDGGNYMVDTRGNLFMTKVTFKWNQDKTEDQVKFLLKEYFNVKNIHVLDYAGYPNSPTDGTGHIDMFCKLLNDDTVLISTSTIEPYKSNAQKAIKYFESIQTPNSKNYTILTVNGFELNNVWYTFTNSLIVNGVVLMPSYTEFAMEGKVAVEQYKKGIKDVIVVGINSDASIVSGGSIHCVTQTIPRI